MQIIRACDLWRRATATSSTLCGIQDGILGNLNFDTEFLLMRRRLIYEDLTRFRRISRYSLSTSVIPLDMCAKNMTSSSIANFAEPSVAYTAKILSFRFPNRTVSLKNGEEQCRRYSGQQEPPRIC